MNPINKNPILIGNLSTTLSPAGKTIATQSAKIGEKTITITLHLSKDVTQSQAKNLMEANLRKASAYAIAIKLGEKNEVNETTTKVNINNRETEIQRVFLKYNVQTEIETISGEKLNKIKEAAEKIEKTFHHVVLNKPFHPNKPLPPLPNQVPVIEQTSKNSLPQPFVESLLNKPNLHSPVNETEGTVFEYTFRNKKNKVVAHEKCQREETVVILLKGLESKMGALEKKRNEIFHKKGDKTDHDYKLLGEISREIRKTKTLISNYRSVAGSATWGSTNTPRFIFQAMDRKEAKAKYAPILCNLRMHTVVNAQEVQKTAVSRSAAISDFSHNEISLQELKDYHELKALFIENKEIQNESEFKRLQKESPMKEQLERLSLYGFVKKDGTVDFNKLEELVTNLKIQALIAYGPEKLLQNPSNELNNLIEGLVDKKWILKKESLSSEQLNIINSIEIPEASLNKIIEERKDRLKQQCIQDLYSHFKNRPVDSTETIYARTSLLDVTKKGTESNGLILHERVQALDMKALFRCGSKWRTLS
jgi:hypothetical protein